MTKFTGQKKSKIYNQINGLLVIDKPIDWTSFDVVAKVRGILKVKKVGHTGTLDPKATGILVLCIGKGTKLAQSLTGFNKEYEGEITLGGTSNTDDSEGDINETLGVEEVPLNLIEEALNTFNGTFDQMPPQFSAKKIKGKKAYELARAGKRVRLKTSSVTIYNLELLDYKWPKLKVKLYCSKGFYVRAFARDLGEKLGVGGYLTGLKRTRVGHFTIEQSIKIEEVNDKKVLPLSAARLESIS